MRKELPRTYSFNSDGNLEVKARNPQMDVVRFNIEEEALVLEIDNREIQLVPTTGRVVLIASSPNMENVMAAAGKSCYSRFPASEVYPNLTTDQSREFLGERIIPSRHYSVAEHGIFTFSIEGISRACSHQLVRHRHASYSQQSQRYTNPVAEKLKRPFFNFVVPPSFRYSESDFRDYVDKIKGDLRFYIKAIKEGHAEEDARMFLPNAAATNVTVSMNPRALLEFASKRTCALAQWEFDMVATQMVLLAYKEAPSIFESAGPECSRDKCLEGKRSCGNPVKDGIVAHANDEIYPHDHLIFGMK